MFSVKKMVLVFLLSGMSNSVRSQMSLTLSFLAITDRNTLRNYENYGDQILQPGLSLSYRHIGQTSQLRFFYDGSWTGFQQLSRRQYQFHSGGIAGSHAAPDSPLSLFWGTGAENRKNLMDYAYYDYTNLSAYFNSRYLFSESLTGYFGLNWRRRQYLSLTQFDFSEFQAFYRQNIYLPTKTTLIASVTAGQKLFTQSVPEDASVDAIIEEIAESTMNPGTRGNGQGRGNQDSGKGGGGKGKNAVLAVTESENIHVTLAGRRIGQILYSLRLAQSVIPKTGFAVEVQTSRHLNGSGRYISYQDGGYEENDLLFDDPYNYQSNTLMFSLTQILPLNIRLKTTWEAKDKTYDYPAFDTEGIPVTGSGRKDQRRSLLLQLTRSFQKIVFLNNLHMHMAFLVYRNHSNDVYFDHDNQVFSLGFQLGI